MTNVVLQMQELAGGYGGGQVLNGVTLQLHAAEVLGLIGRNGVGKTTLMRTLIGVVPAKQGQILLGEIDITQASPQRRARLGIGYVPQGREVFTGLTVSENLQVGMQFVREHREFAKEMLDRVLDYFPILRQRLKQKAGTMSGGEQGVRLENGNYPTLRLYFVQQWRRMRDQQFINRDSFLLKRLNGSFYINRIPECYRRRM
ncbi:ATP-binding cassette domain-containing protein [Klebsiella pneumoniae]|nr:ATP-binding cassette domain-containing protein [Klebsiella pneumoniae]UWS46931.1 ATP-binding cassette domain-containing protein [Klebsiella variicola]